jgi:hypothetical protein
MSRVRTFQIATCVGIALACCNATMADLVQPAVPNYSWLFDDGSGTSATANTGGHNGTLNGSAAWSTEVPFAYAGNKSIDFTGGNVTAVGNAMGTSGTVSLWARTTIDYLHSTNRFFLDSSGPRTYLYDSAVNGWTEFSINGATANDGSLINNSNFPVNTWHHVAVTWDNSLPGDKVLFYLDGGLVASSGTAMIAGTPTSWFFGSRYSNELSWQGQMDEIAFWSVPLSGDNVAWLAHNSLAAPTPEPSTLVLVGTAMVSLLAYAWRKRR